MRLNRRNFIIGSTTTVIYQKASRWLLDFLLNRQLGKVIDAFLTWTRQPRTIVASGKPITANVTLSQATGTVTIHKRQNWQS